MANLEVMLEYQKYDIELRKILDEIERNENYKKMEQAKSEFAAAKSSVNESEKAAENIVNFYNSSIAYYEENYKKYEILEKKLANLAENNETERKEIILQLEVLRDKMTELEKKLSDRKAKTETVIHAYLDSQERGKKLRDIFNSLKAKFEAFKAEKEPAINQLNAKLDALKKKIDPPLFEQYKALTNEKKYPALVEASTADGGKNFSCNGCGLALSQKAKSELAEKNICRCETCRRIIYKK